MKAMVLEHVNAQLALRDIELPKLKEGEAIVRVKSCGVCATDVKIAEGGGPKANLPIVLGHEGAGEIIRWEGESDLEAGQKVVIHPHLYCGRCQNCIEGIENVCTKMRGSLGMTLNGCLAEYAICPISNLVPFPDSISFDQGALAGGTVAVPLSAIRKLGNLAARSALVLGTGALGFNAIQILKGCGAKVFVVGRKESKLKVAQDLGADEIFNSSLNAESYADFAKRVTKGEGVDVALDLAGDADEVPRLIKSIRRGGRLVIIGYSSKDFAGPYQSIALDALQIIGSRSYTRQDLRVAVELVTSGMVKPLIDSRFRLEETNEALMMVKGGRVVGRAVVNP